MHILNNDLTSDVDLTPNFSIDVTVNIQLSLGLVIMCVYFIYVTTLQAEVIINYAFCFLYKILAVERFNQKYQP